MIELQTESGDARDRSIARLREQNERLKQEVCDLEARLEEVPEPWCVGDAARDEELDDVLEYIQQKGVDAIRCGLSSDFFDGLASDLRDGRHRR